MALLDQASGLIDIANSLSQDEIPFKLRCAICNKLAVNAFRLPCCDQAICGNCQASLPESCPVCTHTPVSADLCKPNKALRTTLKAFLRTEEKKREKDRPVNPTPASEAAATPVDAVSTPTETPVANGTSEPSPIPDQQPPQISPEPNTKGESVPLDSTPSGTAAPETGDTESTDADAQQDIAQVEQASGENATPDPDATIEPAASEQPNEEVNAGLPPAPEQAAESLSSPAQTFAQNGQLNHPEGQFNAMNQNGFPNMGWNGNFDYNNMTQFIPNGMPQPGIGQFQNTMGMPGMGMDPMAANQGAFGGYQMGMGGMNNGMNMGMNFNAGQGMMGGWDAQNNMWNGGQDKFNPNAFGNGMGADFGAHSGYAGYNMPQPPRNYPQMHHQQQQFPSNDFQNGFFGPGYGRARGRGRAFVHGGRGGRGGFGRSVHGNHPSAPTNFEPFQQQIPPQYNQQRPNGSLPHQNIPAGPVGPSNNVIDEEQMKKFSDELCPGGEDDLKESEPQPNDTHTEAAAGEEVQDTDAKAPEPAATTADPSPDSGLREIPSVVPSDEAVGLPSMPPGPVGHHSYDPSRGFGGRGMNMNGMRGGMMGGRGNGVLFNGMPPGPPSMHDIPISPSTEPPKGQGVVGAPAAPRAMREGLPNTGIRSRGFQIMGKAPVNSLLPGEDSASPDMRRDDSRQQSRSRSRSPSRRDSRHRHRRHRTESPAPSESEDEKASRHERRRRKSHRDRDDRESTHKAGKEDQYRSPSVESSKRAHRSRRDGDRTGPYKSRSSHHTSRRHRSRSRSPNGETRYRDREQEPKRPEEIDTNPKDQTSLIEKPSLSDRASERRTDKNRSHRRDDEDREGKRRGRDRDRDRDRKRSRRERSESPAESEYSSRHHSRRVKRSHGDDGKYESREKKSADKDRDRGRDKGRERDKDKDKSRRRDRDRERERDRGDRGKTTEKPSKTSSSEKDPHTLEREARNRERMLKEQQRREAVNADRDGSGKGSRRWENSTKQERGLTGGRRLSYKYEDEESDRARAARIEEEREAVRWA